MSDFFSMPPWDGTLLAPYRCPKCLGDAVPKYCQKNCSAIDPALNEHLHWICRCDYTWITPTMDEMKKIDQQREREKMMRRPGV